MPSVIDVLETHIKNRPDKRKFGLVVQGGGMRAVYSAGALTTMLEYGLNNAFEHVIGSSAGALNGAYFISKQPEAVDAYTKQLTNKNFINLLRSEKKVDIDYVVDTVLKHKTRLDVVGLSRGYSKLHVVVTNAKNGRREVISNHKDFAEIFEELRATAALPLLYDKQIKVGDKWYIDGGVADLLPVDVAYKLGCTDIFVIMTQRLASYHFDKRHTRLVNQLIRRFAKKYPTSVKKVLPTNELLLKANLRRLVKPWRKVNIYLLEPSNEEALISLATIDKQKVEELAELGIKDMDYFLHTES